MESNNFKSQKSQNSNSIQLKKLMSLIKYDLEAQEFQMQLEIQQRKIPYLTQLSFVINFISILNNQIKSLEELNGHELKSKFMEQLKTGFFCQGKQTYSQNKLKAITNNEQYKNIPKHQQSIKNFKKPLQHKNYLISKNFSSYLVKNCQKIQFDKENIKPNHSIATIDTDLNQKQFDVIESIETATFASNNLYHKQFNFKKCRDISEQESQNQTDISFEEPQQNKFNFTNVSIGQTIDQYNIQQKQIKPNDQMISNQRSYLNTEIINKDSDLDIQIKCINQNLDNLADLFYQKTLYSKVMYQLKKCKQYNQELQIQVFYNWKFLTTQRKIQNQISVNLNKLLRSSNAKIINI